MSVHLLALHHKRDARAQPSDSTSEGHLPTKCALFESAKLAGVDPHRYVLEATRRAIAVPGTATLPDDVT